MSDPYKVHYAPQAVEDLKDIYAYIAYKLQESAIATAQVNRIRKEIRSLQFMPLRYSVVDWEPWKSMEMHRVSVGNFMVFYVVDTNTMNILVTRIVYGGRDIERLALEIAE